MSAEQTVYILHSQRCKDSGRDLRDCPYSHALDNGINAEGIWKDKQDRPVLLGIFNDRLIPTKTLPEDGETP